MIADMHVTYTKMSVLRYYIRYYLIFFVSQSLLSVHTFKFQNGLANFFMCLTSTLSVTLDLTLNPFVFFIKNDNQTETAAATTEDSNGFLQHPRLFGCSEIKFASQKRRTYIIK